MNESVLRALLRLFALVTDASDQKAMELAKEQVRAYLLPNIAARHIATYLIEFEEYLLLFARPKSGQGERKEKKANTLGSVKVIMVCEKINENLSRPEKITVLIRLIEFVEKGGQISFREENFLETLSRIFNIEPESYSLIRHFIRNSDEPHDSLIYIGRPLTKGKQVLRDKLDGHIQVLVLEASPFAFARYIGKDNLLLNDHKFEPETVYLLQPGSTILGKLIEPVHFDEIIHAHFRNSYLHRISIQAEDISYIFSNGAVGLHPLSFRANSGSLVGIMGASGAGKSTLLNVLNGTNKASSGKVTINGLEVSDKRVKQLIGYIPQDDLLIEELTVFENLFYSGQLCLPELGKGELTARINILLKQIDLFDARDLRVGSVLDKRISGGQRKRLNIALELLREPAVLFVDEPTSGLSSQDSEVVMQMLKNLTYKGQLVFAVIHQPSAHLYRLLDRLMILDKGGYPVYWGHAMDAPSWFRRHAGYIEAPGEDKKTVVNIDPDEMLRIIEARKVDSHGHQTSERINTPEEWYNLYLSEPEFKESLAEIEYEKSVPSRYQTASSWRQLQVHLKRNILSKIRNYTFLLLALFEVPVLAMIVGYFTKYIAGTSDDPTQYVFYLNKNIPAYLFMAIVVAIFVGMQISAEEIIRDRKILKRESFLNLSHWSYLNSKVLYLILLSAFQASFLVIIGNYVLEISGMHWFYFSVLFPTFVFANLVGLNISQSFTSVVAIYVLVPFLVVPQLLLSGVIVDFDTLQKPENQGKKTPFVADLMVARWAYEALAVAQFKENDYQRHFFTEEQEKRNALYEFSIRLPKLQHINQMARKGISADDMSTEQKNRLELLRKEVAKINTRFRLTFDRVGELNMKGYTTLTADLLDAWLNEIERQYRKVWQLADDRLLSTQQKLSETLNIPADLSPLRDRYHNMKLEEQLTGKHNLEKIRVVDDQLVNKSDFIFRFPEHNNGRAHFYAPYKFFCGKKIDTIWFNIGVIWMMNALLYLMLIHNTPKRVGQVIERLLNKSKGQSL